MILIVGYIFNYFIFVISFVVLLRVYNLDRLLFPGNLIYDDPIGCIFDILYIDIGKQCALFYYIYNKWSVYDNYLFIVIG